MQGQHHSFMALADQLQQRFTLIFIDIGHRLVTDENRPLLNQCAANTGALLLATRELVGGAKQLLFKP